MPSKALEMSYVAKNVMGSPPHENPQHPTFMLDHSWWPFISDQFFMLYYFLIHIGTQTYLVWLDILVLQRTMIWQSMCIIQYFVLGCPLYLWHKGRIKSTDTHPSQKRGQRAYFSVWISITLDRKPLSMVWFWSWKINQWPTRLIVFLFIQVYLVPLFLSDSFSCLNNIQLVTEVNYQTVTMNGPLIYSIQITQISCWI